MTEPLSSERLSAFASLVSDGPSSLTTLVEEGVRDNATGSVVIPSSTSPEFRLYQPLSEAAHEYKDWAEHPELRVYTGIDELDRRMRGTAPGEITQILGFSHGGKTVVASQILLNNRDKRMILFTPDETRTAVLVKMVALIHHINAEDLERRIFERDQSAVALLLSTAIQHLPHLGVCEKNLDLREMSKYIEEYESVHGHVDGVMYDFLGLLQGHGEDMTSKWGAMKAWGKSIKKPLFVLHQSSRTAGKDGAKVTMSSGTYGGESESTHIIGVRRKRAELAADIAETMEKLDSTQRNTDWLERRLGDLQYELRKHESTITVNLVKNKRPPMRLVDDLDFNLDQETGRISPILNGDLPLSVRSARDALRQRSFSEVDAENERF